MASAPEVIASIDAAKLTDREFVNLVRQVERDSPAVASAGLWHQFVERELRMRALLKNYA